MAIKKRKKKYVWTAARKRAFAKMRAGLKRKNPAKRRRRKAPSTKARARKPRTTTRVVALLQPPPARRKNPKMARKRKTTTKRRRRRNPGALLVNPRHKRRKTSRRRYRRNPSMRGTAKNLLSIGVPAVGGGVLMGFIDAKFLGDLSPVMRTAAKVLGAFAVGYGGRRFGSERTGTVLTAAALGAIGFEWGIRAGGGIVGATKEETTGALLSSARSNPRVAAGLGALLNGPTRQAAKMYANELIDNEAAQYTHPDDDESEEVLIQEFNRAGSGSLY
jgi:hypothetical protein